jgi:putative nucleotidyltransferase with HDIG domain
MVARGNATTARPRAAREGRGEVTMFARFWRWLSPSKAPPDLAIPVDLPAPGSRAPELPRAPVDTEHARASAAELFFDVLAREQPAPSPVSDEDEPLISALVLELVSFVSRRKVEPPVMPALVPRVLAIVGEPEVDIARLTRVIEQDLAISAKLMSVANSPLFAASAEIVSVRQAVSYLGTEQVAQVAIGLACASSFEAGATARSPFAHRWTRLFHHAMTCAFTAAHLASKRDRTVQEAAFLGGLFHDVGKAVALRAVETLTTSGRLQAPSEQVLDEALQRIHAYPGDEFYDKWTLPASLMELCARHHQLDDLEEPDEFISMVGLASNFDSLLAGGPAERRDALSEARTCADRLGLSDDALHAVYKQTRAFGERTARMFPS